MDVLSFLFPCAFDFSYHISALPNIEQDFPIFRYYSNKLYFLILVYSLPIPFQEKCYCPRFSPSSKFPIETICTIEDQASTFSCLQIVTSLSMGFCFSQWLYYSSYLESISYTSVLIPFSFSIF